MDFEKLTILVVDDNSTMLCIIGTVLREFGVGKILTAKDGASGLELIKSTHVDIIFTDFRMGFIDGDEFVNLVRKSSDSVNRFIPIIMVTAYSEKSKVVAARDSGVDEFICKPVTPNEIYRKLIAVINRPRSYIETGQFFGPDRRRGRGASQQGVRNRRSGDE